MPRLPFPVVGVGASAGGLVAVQRLLEGLPEKPGMAFVVVLHLSPRHESHADRILQRSTKMPVVQVRENVSIEPDTVYVISPRLDLSMHGRQLCVTHAKRTQGAQVAIDLFFRTLATAHRERAIGIMLSGTGADGTVGVARLKESGGVTIAQLPADSEYSDMPANAIASGFIDFVLPVAEMPRTLLDIWRNAQRMALPPVEIPDDAVDAPEGRLPDSEAAMREIIALLAQRTGHDFGHYKRATVLRRMERRLQVRMLKDLPEYLEYLREHPEETQPLLADMLISVTNFFRDREAFEALEARVMPALVAAKAPPEQLRVWNVGCATGEEAYSVAMLLREAVAAAHSKLQFQVFATDIDQTALATARKGCYPESISADVPAARLRRHFVHEQNRYCIKKSVRELVLFAQHNALRDPPFSRLDLVVCRNVLIYLDRGIQEKLIEMFHFALRPGGMLFLGSSESIDPAGTLFEPLDKKHRIYRATTSSHARPRTLALPLRVNPKSSSMALQAKAGGCSKAEVHQRVLEQYAPPSVIVDANASIVHMSKRAGRFLQRAAGVPAPSLVSLVHPELRPALREALLQAARTGNSVEARPVRLERDGRCVFVNMIARPFTDQEAAARYVLVLFEEVEETRRDEPPVDDGASHGRVLALEKELQRMRGQLQATAGQSDTSGDELKAYNEELQAINEELRSTTEELEISAEELQSVNEELITVNQELKAKVDETEQANDDLKNFIASTDIATIFVDHEMHIRRYTPRSEAIFSINLADIGRSLLDVSHRLDYPQLSMDLDAVLQSLRPVEREVRSIDGRTFVANVVPYQTLNRQVSGAVLTFVDVTSLRDAEDLISRGEDDMRLALKMSSDFMVIATDAAGTIVGWNSGAQAVLGYEQAEVVGRSIDMIFVPEDVDMGVPKMERDEAEATGRAEDNRWHQCKDGTRVFCSGVMSRVDVAGQLGFVTIARDVTLQRASGDRREEQLARARERRAYAEATVALKDEFLAVMSHELKHPLNLINVNAEIIARAPDVQLDRSPVATRAMSTLRRAVRTQGKIIDDLLDLSRIRTGKLALDLTAVDLVSLAQAAVETASADLSAAALDIAMTSTDPTVLVHADVARLNQIVWNLLSNAIKFTPPGGRIEVRVSTDDQQARLDVIDSGQGIEPGFLPRIFEMFGQAHVRATSAKSGLGIGLALVLQLVERHGGRIEGASDGPGKGARFTVWLPLYHNSLGLTPSPRAERLPAQCKDINVLVIDDDQLTVDSLKVLLEMEGATVRAATSGPRALDMIREQHPDVVLSDVGMPDMDGYQFLAELRMEAGCESIPVIALTGFGRENDVVRAHSAGFTAHISKPVSVPELLETLCRVAGVCQTTQANPTSPRVLESQACATDSRFGTKDAE